MRLLAGVPENRRKECWWLVRRDGTPVPGDRGGGVALLAELRLTKPIAAVVQAVRLSFALDLFDNGLSRCRKPLSRVVPDGRAPRRYP